jgi:DNA-binding beta-propeller fold protein YncE
MGSGPVSRRTANGPSNVVSVIDVAGKQVTKKIPVGTVEVPLPGRCQACDAQDLSPGEWGTLGSNRPGDST